MENGKQPTLERTLGLWALMAYGIGDILGAGIYGLIGKVAGLAGSATWLSFAVAMCVAALTGLTYAELVSRFPRSGGESHYTLLAFGRPALAMLVGWLVFCSGVVSLSTITHAFAGYLGEMLPVLPTWFLWALFLAGVGGLNFWGIRQSSAANILFTLVEASGLLLVIIVGVWYLANRGPHHVVAAPADGRAWLGVAQGGALAFFAFIGFEDTVNVAEEVKAPDRDFPKAILIAVAVCGCVYMVLAIVATMIIAPHVLAASGAPLLDVVRQAAPAVPPWLFTLIALVAVSNTGLLNSIMASRLVYGMSHQRLLPMRLGRVHPRTRTPYWGVLVVFGAATGLVYSGTLARLAATTSALLLSTFLIVNLALVRIRRRDGRPKTGFSVPLIVPILGAIVSAVLIAFVDRSALLTAAAVLALGLLLVALRHWRGADLDG